MSETNVYEENRNQDIVSRMLDHVEREWFWEQNEEVEGFSERGVERCVSLVMNLCAQLVASATNAGSERDAVMENDVLEKALRDEFRSWTASER